MQNEFLSLTGMEHDSLAEVAIAGFREGIHEYNIQDLNRVDRCITCHLGMENPYLKDAGQPFGAHPGDVFAHHPPDRYGCTICHGGQGRALNQKAAHALDTDTHWDHPLLSYPYSQSTCGQCHLSVFSENEMLAGTGIFQEGHAIFSREGCLGCHKARGVGGIVGPDLTEQGEKTRHEYSFQNIQVEQTVSNWMKEHFRDPEMVSPGSQMLKIDLPEADLDALTTFVLGLAKPDIAFEYFSLEALNEFKGNRVSMDAEQVYSMACSGCHGKDGSGKDYDEYKTGIPAIAGEDFRRVVSGEYIEFTLNRGRSRRQMASWSTDISGLKEKEIKGTGSFVRGSFREDYPSHDHLKLIKADPETGRSLYDSYCSTCHGIDGAGSVAVSLIREDFLRNADNEFIYKSLVFGRPNATMPSWSNLKNEDIYAVLKYLRSFQDYRPHEQDIDFVNADTVEGGLRYHFLCSRCHGEAGQGQTGPSIINKGFLRVASDGYLYNTIAYGRGHTAMFGWSVDVYNQERLSRGDIGNIIAFLRMRASERPDYIYAGANPGDKYTGEQLYRENCATCHGNNGEGIKAPALNNQELLNAGSNGYFMATITLGREGTDMPEWGRTTEEHEALTGRERQDIVAHIRNWERIRIGY